MFSVSLPWARRTPQPTALATSATGSAPADAAPLDLAALVGPAGWASLPAAVQRRFAAAHADTCYRGQMDLRCSAVGHVYAALVSWLGGPLTHINAQGVPTTVRVGGNGQGGVVWERCFHRASASAEQGQGSDPIVRSTKELDAQGQLRERTDGGLSMVLDVLEEAGSLVFRSRRYSWVRGRLRLPVPMWLTPGVCCVTHTDLGAGLFRFTLSMDHPLWGQTFFQTGVFADPVSSSSSSSDESTS